MCLLHCYKMRSIVLVSFFLSAASLGFNNDTYDFIIVGAGTAGCLLANRLSENPSWSVLLVEAGGHEHITDEIPGFASPPPFKNPKTEWLFFSEPSVNAGLIFPGRRMPISCGKALGGTSAINDMLYYRGNPLTFDRWESVYANPGWSYKNIESYFQKFENYKGHQQGILGTSGELYIEENPYHTTLSNVFLDAVREYGLPVTRINPLAEVKYSGLIYITDNGTRFSSNRAFLEPVKHRPNLRVMTYTFVRKVLLNQTAMGIRAFGIEYQSNPVTTRKIYARKEVILCAGAINTPKILMLSGIGPKKHLNEINIPVLRNLPVGDNLMEHTGLAGIFLSTNITLFPNQDYALYLTNHSGPLSLTYNLDVVGITNVGGVNTTGVPNIEFAIRVLIPNTKLLGRSVGHTIILLQQPTSRGTIRLRSVHPLVPPNITLNLLADPLEVETFLNAIRQLERIVAQPSLRKINAKIAPAPLICSGFKKYSDEFYRCLIRQTSLSVGHLCGTCKMGPESDSSTVVDSELRVHGVHYLRVMDASVFPEITTGHLEAPVLMVAEKGADLIKARWTIRRISSDMSLNRVWTEVKKYL